MSFIDHAIEKSRTTLLILALLLIAGTNSYISIPKESDPDINIPIIYVSLHLEGISPDDSQRLLIRPMEQELSSIEGLKEMRATSYLGGGNVILEFEAGFNADAALDDVREAVDKAKSELPDSADEPSVNEVNFSLFPVLIVTLSGDLPERTLLKMARDLQDRLEAIPQVLEAPIAGDREEQVEIVIDPLLIESYGLQGNELIDYFNRSNRLVAAGNMDTGSGQFDIKLPGLFETVKDILEMPVKVEGDSTVVFGEMAEVRRTFKDPQNFARLNGEKSLALEVVKRTGENVIETIEAVKETVRQEQKFWPNNVQVTFSQDRSEDIRDMLRDLQNNILSAVLLVMIVCVAAIGFRAASLVGIAIPGSFLTGILVIYMMGLTVNVVVLFALILAVGMLVDGAIVVTEYADREMIEGSKPKLAYAEAARRMAWPIIASTATTLAAFMPLLFWPGIVGEFMYYLPLTLIATLSASLLMALIFIPVLGVYIGKPLKVTNEKRSEDMSLDELLNLKGFSGDYIRFLNKVLKKPGRIIAIAVALLIGIQVLYGIKGKGVEFFPEIEPEFATVLVHARGNLSIYEKDSLIKEVESKIGDLQGVRYLYARSGAAAGQGSDLAEDVIGQIQLEFEDWDQREPADVILAEVRERTRSITGVRVETRKAEEGPKSGKAIQIQIRSRFADDLDKAADMILKAFDQVDGLIDIEDDRPMPGIEWEIEVDRAQASKFGLDTSSIGNSVRLVTNGLKVAEYTPDDADDEIDIVLRHTKDFRTLDQLDAVRVETGVSSVPISNFVKRVAKPRVGQIHRIDQQKSVKIQADVEQGINITQKIKELESVFKTMEMPETVRIEFAGDNENQEESQAFLMSAFGVALFVMAIILVTQFNSFYSAFLILSAVIMSTIGVFIGLLLMGKPFGIVMTGVGVISLAGIVVNNNIVLIDTYDVFIKQKMEPLHAVLLTGYQRLRPVLLTTVTTVLGLMPMVLQMNIDFIDRTIQIGAPSTQWWVGLSTAIVFGLIFSTLLTLVFTPAALMARIHFTKFLEKKGYNIRSNA